MQVNEILIMLASGFGAGVLGGMLGIGGGMVLLPVLQFALGYPPPVAVGTSLLAVVFTAIAGVFQHTRIRNIDWKTVAWTAPAGLVGVGAGSALFHFIKADTVVINLVLGVVLLWGSGRMIYEVFARRRETIACEMGGSRGARIGIGAGAGFLTGISGLGGGAILVPGFTFFCGASMKLAVGTSMATFLWTALVGAGLKIADGVTDLPAGIVLGIASAFGAFVGAGLVPRVPAASLRAAFGVAFVYVAFKYILACFGIAI